MTTTIGIRRAGVVLAATAALLASSAPFAGAKGLEVRTSGACSAGATWKLKAKTDDGRLEVELEVDANRNGQVWTWAMRDNGVAVGSGSATTVAPSGSFEVERTIVDLAGTDRVVFRAVRDGQACRGVVNY